GRACGRSALRDPNGAPSICRFLERLWRRFEGSRLRQRTSDTALTLPVHVRSFDLSFSLGWARAGARLLTQVARGLYTAMSSAFQRHIVAGRLTTTRGQCQHSTWTMPYTKA